ncbi:hypothetical protein [Nonomuraea sp. NPDC049784]|uniref:hypothetical protein n=1 Tax=Nonomuraea sp. NPDC049784 TaxID=3154361 RepID=UPI00340EE6D2
MASATAPGLSIGARGTKVAPVRNLTIGLAGFIGWTNIAAADRPADALQPLGLITRERFGPGNLADVDQWLLGRPAHNM